MREVKQVSERHREVLTIVFARFSSERVVDIHCTIALWISDMASVIS